MGERGIDRLPSGGYRGRVMWHGQRYTTPVYDRLEDCRVGLAALRADLARGDWLDPRRAGITLGEWWKLWEPTRDVRHITRTKDADRWRLHVRPYLDGLPLAEVTAFRVQRWMADLTRDGRGPATIGKALTLLRTCLMAAVDDDRLRANPCARMRPPEHRRPDWRLVTRADFARLLSEVPARWRPLVLLAAYTGLSASEIVGLRRCDLDLTAPSVTVVAPVVQVKGHPVRDGRAKARSRQRTVPLVVPELMDALAAHVAALPGLPAAPLFTGTRGGILNWEHFSQDTYRPATRRAGLAGVRFHDLRHSCCTWLLDGGMPVHRVREVMGHSVLTTTQQYVRPNPGALVEGMAKALG